MSLDFDFLFDTLRQLLAAVPTTLGLFFASLVLGGLLSLVIVTMRVSPRWLANRFARAYILVFRGSPLLIRCFSCTTGRPVRRDPRELHVAAAARAVRVRGAVARAVYGRLRPRSCAAG